MQKFVFQKRKFIFFGKNIIILIKKLLYQNILTYNKKNFYYQYICKNKYKFLFLTKT